MEKKKLYITYKFRNTCDFLACHEKLNISDEKKS